MNVFNKKFICSDATIDKRGKFRELIGAATIFENYEKFRKLYFETIEATKDKFNIDFNKKIIKSADIVKRTPSFRIKGVLNFIVENLIQSDSIKFISLTNTHLNKPITYNWEKKKKISGINFLEKELFQYYPIIPIWRYLGKFKEENLIKTVILDGINGKITQAWADIGKEVDEIYIVPHGDWTHPAISFCDLLSSYVKRNLSKINQKVTYELLKKFLSDDKIYTCFVSDPFIDHIKPKFPYSIRPYLYYLHPLFLLYSKKLKKRIPKQIIEESELFNISHMLAEKYGGSSFYIDVVSDFPILEGGDTLICLDEESIDEAILMAKLYPSKRIKIMDKTDFFNFAKGKLEK